MKMALIDIFFLPHFYLMLVGFIFYLIAILFIIVKKPTSWFLYHTLFTMIGMALMIIGLIILAGLNLSLPHAIIGLINIIALIVIVLIGIIARVKKKVKLRKVHIWIGRIIFIIVLVVIILGVTSFL